jgi:hypothetical protein
VSIIGSTWSLLALSPISSTISGRRLATPILEDMRMGQDQISNGREIQRKLKDA